MHPQGLAGRARRLKGGSGARGIARRARRTD
jgi:hypothetical protein